MPVSVDIVVPVLNEEKALPGCVEQINAFVAKHPGREWNITIADNGSDDRTPEVTAELSERYGNVSGLRLEQRGRGRALKAVWAASNADVRCYMDVDLSTRLEALPPLVSAIADEGFGVAIGSRLSRGSVVEGRSLKREITSRGYNALIKLLFPRAGFNDAQCGFKAVSAQVAETVVPMIKDNAWFFDTELLLVARNAGFRIKQVPVHWVDDPDTRVKIVSTAVEDVKGLLRLRFGGRPRPERDLPPGA